MLFKPRYRIVKNKYHGYSLEVWRWWWPVWYAVPFSGCYSVEMVEKYLRGILDEQERYKNRFVKYLGTGR